MLQTDAEGTRGKSKLTGKKTGKEKTVEHSGDKEKGEQKCEQNHTFSNAKMFL